MITINQELCIKCGACARDCVGKLIRERDGEMVGPKECIECGHCFAVCPAAAVTIEGYELSEVQELAGKGHPDPVSILQMIKARRSIRQYQEKRVGEQELAMIVEAARYTATAKNVQGSKYIFVQDRLEEFKELVWSYISEQTGNKAAQPDRSWLPYYSFLRQKQKNPGEDFLFRNAPAVILIATENQWDAGLEAQNMEHEAAALGMGMLYNGYMTRLVNGSERLKDWLGIPGEQISAVMLLGYPAVEYRRTVPRKPAELIRR